MYNQKKKMLLDQSLGGWPEVDQLAIYTTQLRSWTHDYWNDYWTNQDSSREEDLNQGPPDFKCIALNHSAMLPP